MVMSRFGRARFWPPEKFLNNAERAILGQRRMYFAPDHA